MPEILKFTKDSSSPNELSVVHEYCDGESQTDLQGHSDHNLLQYLNPPRVKSKHKKRKKGENKLNHQITMCKGNEIKQSSTSTGEARIDSGRGRVTNVAGKSKIMNPKKMVI